jgi:hypothetical protein
MTQNNFRSQRRNPASDTSKRPDNKARGVPEDVEQYMAEMIMDPHFFIF